MQIQYRHAALASGLMLALCLPNLATAQRGDPSYFEPPSFADLDLNDNGVLDLGEAEGHTPLAGQWGRFDRNGDDVIDRSEFAAFEAYAGPTPEVVPPAPANAASEEPTFQVPGKGPERNPPGFAQLDIDGNGVLSKGEAGGRKGLLDEWWQVDGNKDNVIERSEFSVFERRGPALPLSPGTTLAPTPGAR
jgi:hypothetical protein